MLLPDGRVGVLDFGAVKRLPDGIPPALGRNAALVLTGQHAELLASMFVGRDGARGEPDHDLLVRDEYVLQGLLADRGYLDARVEPLGVERSSDGLYFDVHVRLREGARYRVRSLAFNERDEHGKTVSPRPPG